MSEARDKGFPAPAKQAVANAAILLDRMYDMSPRRFEIYPTPDAEIAIDVPIGYARSVIVLCCLNGTITCLITIDGKRNDRSYTSIEEVKYEFIQDLLRVGVD